MLFEIIISVIVERYGTNRRVCVGITGSSYVMKRERDITNGSVIKAVNIVKKRGTANSVIAESVDVIKQRKEAIPPLKLPLSLSRSASVPLVVLSWQVVFEQHRCSASTCIVIRPPWWGWPALQQQHRC